jgi:hypothetical protein
MYNILNNDIINLIKDYSGNNKYWKNRFNVDVIPQLEKGFKMVALYDNKPCLNCYFYADGINSFCINDLDNDQYTIISYNEYTELMKHKNMSYFDFKYFNKNNGDFKFKYLQFKQYLKTYILNNNLYKKIQIENNFTH